MPDQPSPKPTNKVTASTLGAALAALVGALFHLDSAVTVPLGESHRGDGSPGARTEAIALDPVVASRKMRIAATSGSRWIRRVMRPASVARGSCADTDRVSREPAVDRVLGRGSARARDNETRSGDC